MPLNLTILFRAIRAAFSTPPSSFTPAVIGLTSATQNEGTSLVHTVTLGGTVAGAPALYPFSITGVTAYAPGDFGATPTFSNGVTFGGGSTITVPIGVSSFTITVSSVQDAVSEPVETYQVTVGSLTNTGTIVDDDTTVVVSSVSSASGTEGSTVVHTVTLSSVTVVTQLFPFSISGGTATQGTDYTAVPTLSNGVTISGGNFSVPSGVTSFTVTVSTTQDAIAEGNETYSITVGGLTNTGTIVDDDGAPSVSSVTSAVSTEGTSLVHTVTLTNSSASVLVFPFSITSVTASTPSDYSVTPTFSNSVTLNAGNISVPAGVTSFTVTVGTSQDTVFEGTETYTISVGGIQNTGTINDDDSAPTVASVSSASATEGTSIVHTVSITGTAQAARTFAVTLVDGTAAGTDYTATLSNGMFSNSVTVSGGNITVPSGVTSFTVTIPTTSDTVFEGNETYTLTIGGASGTGTINNDDAAPTVTSVSSASATEGASVVHTVSLAGTSQSTSVFAIALASVTASGTDYTVTLSNGMFTNGVTVSGGNVTVPAGVTSFTVTVATTADTVFEANETYTLTVGGASGTGTINNDDAAPTITSVSSVSVVEGNNAVHTVSISGTAQAAQVYAATITGGTASGADYTGTLSNGMFSNGVTVSGGSITVPAGVTSFTVSVVTADDAEVESAETYTLTIGGASGTGTITDNDVAPTSLTFSLTLRDVTGGSPLSASTIGTINYPAPPPPPATITPTLNASRVTGVAPLAVTFDALGTLAPDLTSFAFGEIDFEWDFGDERGEFWDYGTNPGGNNKNIAYGPVVAHVFKTPGAHTVTRTARFLNSSNVLTTATATIVINAQDPDTVFAGAATICISQNSLPVAGQGGAPAGCAVQQVASWSTVQTLAQTYKRILLKRGDVWPNEGTVTLGASQAGPGLIGAYGTGNKPVITNGNISVQTSDWRVIDLFITGASQAERTWSNGINTRPGCVDALFLRTDVRWCWMLASFENSNGVYLVDSDLGLVSDQGADRGYANWTANVSRMTFLGVRLHGSDAHTTRWQGVDTAVCSNSTFEDPKGPAAWSMLTIRGKANDGNNGVWNGLWTENVVVSDTYVESGTPTAYAAFSAAPQNAESAERLRNFLFERNHVVGLANGPAAFGVASGLTVRNNIFQTLGGVCVAVEAKSTAGSPDMSQAFFFNNTYYKSDTTVTTAFDVFWIPARATGLVIRNELAYAPNTVTPRMFGNVGGVEGTNYIQSNNSSNAQILSTRPWAATAPVTPGDFAPNSYAIDGGTWVPNYRNYLKIANSGTREIGAI